MTQTIKQAEFEKTLTDLEKLMAMKFNALFCGAEALKDVITIKFQDLANVSVFASESSTLKDIERLVELRLSLGPPCSSACAAQYRYCINPILQTKIEYLVDSDKRKLDVDPFEAAYRIAAIETQLSHKERNGYTWGVETRIAKAKAQKLQYMANRMMPSEKKPDRDLGATDMTTLTEPVVCTTDMRELRDDTEPTVSELQDQLLAMKVDITKSRDEVERADSTQAYLEATIADLRKSIDSLEGFSDLTNEIDEESKAMRSLEATNVELSDRIRQLEKEPDIARSTVFEMQNELCAVKEELAKAQNEIEQKSKTIDSLRVTDAKLTGHIGQLETQLQKTRDTLEQIEGSIRSHTMDSIATIHENEEQESSIGVETPASDSDDDSQDKSFGVFD